MATILLRPGSLMCVRLLKLILKSVYKCKGLIITKEELPGGCSHCARELEISLSLKEQEVRL